MFGPVGRAYVYFTYGSHYCVNVSARSPDAPAGAVLIRSVEPVEGVDYMAALRGTGNALLLTSGPGRLTQAMAITLAHNGLDTTDPASSLCIEPGSSRSSQVVATPRIGITRAVGVNWRFADPSSRFVSKKRGFLGLTSSCPK
jgi:DNA-3-methyladenine glycosylase